MKPNVRKQQNKMKKKPGNTGSKIRREIENQTEAGNQEQRHTEPHHGNIEGNLTEHRTNH